MGQGRTPPETLVRRGVQRRPDLARPERADARARFLREAQALARLSQPNIISVYEVGAADGHTFIAMEYVKGRTFADWATASERSWSEVLAVLIKAGYGLAAAHAAGLIHRDFKPTNLLVGDDGRVLVTDFGLARATTDGGVGDAAAAPGGSQATALLAWVTRTGTVQGTPRYMAPEQQEGRVADSRADQFSFCVTLYEALFAAHPFTSAARSQPTRSPPYGAPDEPRIPAHSRVPVWLQRAVLRGLRARPDERYPSMDGLLAALGQGPVRRRRRLQLAAAVAIAGVGIGIGANAMTRDPMDAVCAGAESKLASAWNERSRAQLRAAFAATGLAYAADAWRRVEPILEGHAAQWAAMHRDACEATRVRGEQSELLMDRRMACLDVRRREHDQLLQLFRRADADIVEHAVQAAHGLSDIQACGDLAALTRAVAPPPDPVISRRVEDARQIVAEARVLNDAGKYADGLALIGKLAGDQALRDYLPLRAEVSYETARLHLSKSDWAQALAQFDDAIWAAEASGHDRIAMLSLSGAVLALADLDRFKEAREMVRRGEAAVLRVGPAPEALAEFRTNVCIALDLEGRYSEAEERCRQALDLRRREFGADHPDVAASLYRLGLLAGRYEHSEQALGYFNEALAIDERALGPEHPTVQRVLIGIAKSEVRLRRVDEALAHCRRAVAIAQSAFGRDSVAEADTLIIVGQVFIFRREYDEAAATFRRALAIYEKTVGPDHSLTAGAHVHLGNALQQKDENGPALEHYKRAATILAATLGTGHLNYALVELNVCSVDFDLRRMRDALAACKRGLDGLDKAVGPNAPAVADALVGMMSRVYVANGMMREAYTTLERGIAMWPKTDPVAGPKIAERELRFAELVWDRFPPVRARARAIALRARDRLRAAGAGTGNARRLADVEAWLAAHGGAGRGRAPR